ncbi:DUF6093 family protein [Citricoccus sp. K5]|uniref:DUF6093 family protein n=1 Tax=Citricoccus sp. K5 TaxID=2653135 RepID=UPI00210FEE0B|nr:DUF6093 family protein [Citricoccus sp. K5]
MVGLPNHQVIPPEWQQHHRPVAESTMTGLCRVHGADAPPVWPDVEPSPGPAYASDVPCRVQQRTGEREAEVVSQDVSTREYLVTLPLSRMPDLTVTGSGPYITVTGYKPGHDGDPHLIGRRLKVTSIQRGTLVWERDLTCLDDLTQGGG